MRHSFSPFAAAAVLAIMLDPASRAIAEGANLTSSGAALSERAANN
jgi:hypothetical protein